MKGRRETNERKEWINKWMDRHNEQKMEIDAGRDKSVRCAVTDPRAAAM